PDRLEEIEELPVEVPAGQWEAPPVRNPAVADTAPEPAIHPELAGLLPAAHEETAPVVTRRHARRTMAVVFLLVVGVLGGGGTFVWFQLREREDKLAEKAQEVFKEKRWNNAAANFQQLAEKYPSSPRAAEYRFMHGLCELRSGLEVGGDAAAALDLADRFLTD